MNPTNNDVYAARTRMRVRVTDTNTINIQLRAMPGQPFQADLEIAAFHGPVDRPRNIAARTSASGIYQRVEQLLQEAYGTSADTPNPDNMATEMTRYENASRTYYKRNVLSVPTAAEPRVHNAPPFRIESANLISVETTPYGLEQRETEEARRNGPSSTDGSGRRGAQAENNSNRVEPFSVMTEMINFRDTLNLVMPGLSAEIGGRAMECFRIALEDTLRRHTQN